MYFEIKINIIKMLIDFQLNADKLQLHNVALLPFRIQFYFSMIKILTYRLR